MKMMTRSPTEERQHQAEIEHLSEHCCRRKYQGMARTRRKEEQRRRDEEEPGKEGRER